MNHRTSLHAELAVRGLLAAQLAPLDLRITVWLAELRALPPGAQWPP